MNVKFLLALPFLSMFNTDVFYLLTYIYLTYSMNSDYVSHSLCLLIILNTSHEFRIFYSRIEEYWAIPE